MPNFRSLVGGPFGDATRKWAFGPPTLAPVAWLANNPGAINGASWERSWPGYLYDQKFDGKNNTTVFETPEQGVAVWMELMRRYRGMGKMTMRDIVIYYGGGQANYEAEYEPTLVRWTGLSDRTEIKIDGSDDATLLKFAKAMFAYEVGVHPPRPLPWTDAQIKYGFALFRGTIPIGKLPPSVAVKKPSIWDFLFKPIFGSRS